MEAQAHGRAEQRLIFNRDPGVDSIVELVPLLADGADETEARLLAELCRDLTEHNVQQLRIEHGVTGWANELATDLHALGLNGAGVGSLGVLAIARRLRLALDVLADVPADVIAAVREVDAVLAAAPRAQIFRRSLETNLGGRKYRRLTELAERRSRSSWS